MTKKKKKKKKKKNEFSHQHQNKNQETRKIGEEKKNDKKEKHGLLQNCEE